MFWFIFLYIVMPILALILIGIWSIGPIIWCLPIARFIISTAISLIWIILRIFWLGWFITNGPLANLWLSLTSTSSIMSIMFDILIPVCIIAMWRIFVKSWEKWRKALIPIYNTYITYKITDMKKMFYYSFAFLLPVVILEVVSNIFSFFENIALGIFIIWYGITLITSCIVTYKLPKKFGRSNFASVLCVIFTPICLLILGFGKYEYSTNINNNKIREVNRNPMKNTQTFSYEDAKAMMREINAPIHNNLDTSVTNLQFNEDMVQQPAEPSDNQQNNKIQ